MNIAAIFAGGVGSRMGSSIPKQFLEIYGKPIIIHTLEKFQYNDEIDYIFIGCKKKYISYLKSLIKKYNITKVKESSIISGGSCGLETIYKLLKKISKEYDDAIVLIHDGVRPNIDDTIINKNIELALKHGNAITAVSCVETPLISENGKTVFKCLEREKVYMAKAPQTFRLSDILNAYDNLFEKYETFKVDGMVDSCSVAINSGIKINIVEGDRNNIKVTTPNDYIEMLGKLISNDYKNFFDIMNTRNERGNL